MKGPTIMLILFVVVGFMMALTAFASGNPHHDHMLASPIIVNNDYTEQSIKNEVRRSGAAMGGAAGGHQFYWGNNKWKWSLVGSHYDDSTAFSAAIGKRINNTIHNFSITTEDEDSEYMYLYNIGGDF